MHWWTEFSLSHRNTTSPEVVFDNFWTLSLPKANLTKPRKLLNLNCPTKINIKVWALKWKVSIRMVVFTLLLNGRLDVFVIFMLNLDKKHGSENTDCPLVTHYWTTLIAKVALMTLLSQFQALGVITPFPVHVKVISLLFLFFQWVVLWKEEPCWLWWEQGNDTALSWHWSEN